MFASFMHEWAPITPTGRVLSSRRWRKIKKKVDGFFERIPRSEHQIWNRSVKERKRRKRTPHPKEGYIYLIKSGNGYYKIGRTKNVEKRLSQHERDYPLELRVIHTVQSATVKRDEKRLLRAFRKAGKNLQGEWFELDHHDVEWIKDIEDYSINAAFLKFDQRETLYPAENSVIDRVKGILGRFLK